MNKLCDSTTTKRILEARFRLMALFGDSKLGHDASETDESLCAIASVLSDSVRIYVFLALTLNQC